MPFKDPDRRRQYDRERKRRERASGVRPQHTAPVPSTSPPHGPTPSFYRPMCLIGPQDVLEVVTGEIGALLADGSVPRAERATACAALCSVALGALAQIQRLRAQGKLPSKKRRGLRPVTTEQAHGDIEDRRKLVSYLLDRFKIGEEKLSDAQLVHLLEHGLTLSKAQDDAEAWEDLCVEGGVADPLGMAFDLLNTGLKAAVSPSGV